MSERMTPEQRAEVAYQTCAHSKWQVSVCPECIAQAIRDAEASVRLKVLAEASAIGDAEATRCQKMEAAEPSHEYAVRWKARSLGAAAVSTKILALMDPPDPEERIRAANRNAMEVSAAIRKPAEDARTLVEAQLGGAVSSHLLQLL